MSEPPVRAPEARGILALARKDRNAARRALAALDLDAQVALVCEAPDGVNVAGAATRPPAAEPTAGARTRNWSPSGKAASAH